MGCAAQVINTLADARSLSGWPTPGRARRKRDTSAKISSLSTPKSGSSPTPTARRTAAGSPDDRLRGARHAWPPPSDSSACSFCCSSSPGNRRGAPIFSMRCGTGEREERIRAERTTGGEERAQVL